MPPIGEILRDKTLLLTGATGFVGKVILHQLLLNGPSTLRVACLVRPRGEPHESAADRFRAEVLASEMFRPLKRAGARIDDLAARIEVIEGDLALPHLGLAPDRFGDLARRADLIVNCAGHVDVEGALDVELAANTTGVEEILRLAASWRRAGRRVPPALCHVSTCFVCGRRSGRIREEVAIDEYPRRDELGIPFFPGDEVQALQELVDRVRAEVAPASPGAERWLSQRLAVEGRARAEVWGWPNVHTFTKALGERALAANHGDVPLSIVRPSMIGAAVRDPVPGWIEGDQAIAKLAYLAWRGQRRFPIHPGQVIDIVPVDLVANATIAIAAMTLAGEAAGVYQLSSGDRNPLDAKAFVRLTHAGLRRARRRGAGRRRLLAWLTPGPRGSVVSERTYERYSAPARARLWSRAAGVLDRLPPRRLWSRGAGALRRRERDARLADAVFQEHRPFLRDAQPIFEAARTHDLYERLAPEDKERFTFSPQDIDWRRYLRNIYMEGLLRHAFPAMGEELAPLHADLAGDSIGELVESAARRYPDNVAVEFWSPSGMAQWTYRELTAETHTDAAPPELIARIRALVAGGSDHASLAHRVVELSASIHLTSRDTVLALSPLHCERALAIGVVLPLARGARVLCLELDPDTAAADWRSVRISRVVGTAADLARWRGSRAKFGRQFRGFVRCCGG